MRSRDCPLCTFLRTKLSVSTTRSWSCPLWMFYISSSIDLKWGSEAAHWDCPLFMSYISSSIVLKWPGAEVSAMEHAQWVALAPHLYNMHIRKPLLLTYRICTMGSLYSWPMEYAQRAAPTPHLGYTHSGQLLILIKDKELKLVLYNVHTLHNGQPQLLTERICTMDSLSYSFQTREPGSMEYTLWAASAPHFRSTELGI